MKKKVLLMALFVACLWSSMSTSVWAEGFWEGGHYDNGTEKGIEWDYYGRASDEEITTLTLTGEGTIEANAPWDTEFEEWQQAKSQVQKLVIEPGITEIGWYAFMDYEELVEVELPDTLTTINGWAFRNCNKLKSITIPDGVEIVWSCAFMECSNLESVTMTDSVQTIGPNAFYGTKWIDLIRDKDGFAVIDVNGILLDYSGDASEIWIPNNAKHINDSAMRGNNYIEVVNVPAEVQSIGEYAFFECDNLKEVYFEEGLRNIHSWVFEKCTNLTTVHLPNTLKTIGRETFFDCTHLEEILIPDSVEDIGEDAFVNTGLTSITLPITLTDIGAHAVGYTMVIENEENIYVPVEGFRIYGYTGSEAEIYANEESIEFVSIGSMEDSEEPAHPSEPEVPTDPSEPDTTVEEVVVVPENSTFTYVAGSDTNAVIYCTGEFEDFINVMMDGILVDPSNYTAEEGSTIITFTSEYLDTLSLGEHTVTINFTDDSVDVKLTIIKNTADGTKNELDKSNKNETDAPNTGEKENVYVYAIITFVALSGIIEIMRKKRII